MLSSIKPKQFIITLTEFKMNKIYTIKEEFGDWFWEMEGYGFRSERFYSDFDQSVETKNSKLMVEWLQSAFEMGYTAGQLAKETE